MTVRDQLSEKGTEPVDRTRSTLEMVSETVDCTSSVLGKGTESVGGTRSSFDKGTVTVDCTRFVHDKGTLTVDCTRSAPNFRWRLLSYHGDCLVDFVSRCCFDPAHVRHLCTGDYSSFPASGYPFNTIQYHVIRPLCCIEVVSS